MIRALAVALTVLLASGAAAQVPSERPAPVAASRQILVLLRQPPAHYRGGAGYGGGAYGDVVNRAARERLGRRIAREHALTFVGDWPMPAIGLDCFIMAAPDDGSSLDEVAAKVARDADVEWAQPVHAYRTLGAAKTYNDPLLSVAPATRQWRLAELHALATGKGVTVAVIDTRVDAGHPDLAGQVVVDADFVAGRPAAPETHGTGVAGVIAAIADNGVGAAGVAPRAKVMGLRACWQLASGDSACDSLSLAKALHYAIERKAQVINLSLSGPPDRLLGRLIDVGIDRGAVVVAAVDPDAPAGGFPASRPGVIAVSDDPSAAAPRGVVSAPGRGVPTTQPGGRWYLVDGSSYAAAHVSGLMALTREGRASGRRSTTELVSTSGGGIIDARATLQRSMRDCGGACAGVRAAESGR